MHRTKQHLSYVPKGDGRWAVGGQARILPSGPALYAISSPAWDVEVQALFPVIKQNLGPIGSDDSFSEFASLPKLTVIGVLQTFLRQNATSTE
jgi:hypothetical protein